MQQNENIRRQKELSPTPAPKNRELIPITAPMKLNNKLEETPYFNGNEVVNEHISPSKETNLL